MRELTPDLIRELHELRELRDRLVAWPSESVDFRSSFVIGAAGMRHALEEIVGIKKRAHQLKGS